MNGKYTKEQEEFLLEAIESLKSFGQELRESREKQLWKKVELPCSLHHAISRLPKHIMDRIRKNYDFRGISALKKAELALELSRLIPQRFKEHLYLLDQDRYDLVSRIVKNSGYIPNDIALDLSDMEAFLENSLIFPGIYDNKQVLFIPSELMDIYNQINGKELRTVVKRNTNWIRLTNGMLYYYGVANAGFMKKKIEELTKEQVDLMEYHNIISHAGKYYGNANYTYFGYANSKVFNAKEILEEQIARPEIDFYPFSMEQLLNAGDPNYTEITPEMISLIDLLSEYYEISEDDTVEIISQLNYMIQEGESIPELMEYLVSWLESPSFEFVAQLTEKVTELCNNTRRWILKGNTPNEVFEKEKRYLNPLPASRKKVGRNDPCPCGSGKKYKKCCGR